MSTVIAKVRVDHALSLSLSPLKASHTVTKLADAALNTCKHGNVAAVTVVAASNSTLCLSLKSAHSNARMRVCCDTKTPAYTRATHCASVSMLMHQEIERMC